MDHEIDSKESKASTVMDHKKQTDASAAIENKTEGKESEVMDHEKQTDGVSAVMENETQRKESEVMDYEKQKRESGVLLHEKDRIPTERELTITANAIGQNWEILGTHLGLSAATIEQIQMDYDTSVRRIQRMLLDWKQRNGEQATLGSLYKAMKEAQSVTIDWDVVQGIFSSKDASYQSHRENRDYMQLKQELKNDLIQLNRDQHGAMTISPMQIVTPLSELYVTPTINRTDHRIGTFSKHNCLKQVTALKEIFCDQATRYQHMYISAEAGFGKTVFAKRLVLIWCEANDKKGENSAFSEDELLVMKDFEFVFFVSLKDADPLDCKIDDMIQNQIIDYLARSSQYSRRFVEDILSQEPCLVILDGLDEWSHPTSGICKMKMSERKSNIPHKRSRGTCTFLTTTRPWKMTCTYISKTKIDQQLEIKGLNKIDAEQLKTKISQKLKSNPDKENIASRQLDFDGEDLDKKTESIKSNPMLIMYMTCLQHYNRTLGKSMCELYCNLFEMMLQRSVPEREINAPAEQVIPGCFKHNEYSISYFRIVKDLGRLAFVTLFYLYDKPRLVFPNALAKEYMSDLDLSLWLKAGIFTLVGFNKRLPMRKPQVTFVHKIFHEFFAALYMCTEKSEMIVENILKSCRHVSDILERKYTFIFLSGFCSKQSNIILSQLANVVAHDSLAERLRHTVYPYLDYWEMCDLMEEYQKMVIDCLNESADNHQFGEYYLQDIVLNYKHTRRYICALKQLLRHVKLLKVGRHLSNDDVHELLKELNLFNPKSLQCLEKLDMWGTPKAGDIDMLLVGSAKTLKCLLLHGCKMNNGKETEDYIQFSDFTMQKLQSLECLESIDLFSIEMKHQQIVELVEWLEQNRCLTQIKLSRIKCSEHESHTEDSLKGNITCEVLTRPLDFSRLEKLKTLGLGTMRTPAVNVTVSSLEECWMERNEMIIMHILGSISQSTARLHTLVIEFVEDQNVVENIVNIIPQLTHLSQLQLKGMDLQKRDLALSQRDTFKHIRLIEIQMTILALEKLVDFFKTCSNSVATELASCVIESDKDSKTKTYENLKSAIEKSGLFDVLFSTRCCGHDNSFAFKTLVSDSIY